MERVWRRVQNSGRRGVATATSTSSNNASIENTKLNRSVTGGDPQQHLAQEENQSSRGRSNKKNKGPQKIVCGCQEQPCTVHPVLIRMRKNQRPQQPNCNCPPESHPCPHLVKSTGSSRIRRCKCKVGACRHIFANASCQPQGFSSLLATSSTAAAVALSAGTGQYPHCPHGDDEVCNCQSDARPCLHTIKTNRSRRDCDCSNQSCSHGTFEGRIKRVTCRVRRAGCAMARCTAELAMLHLHWELSSECAPCRPRALTRRLCRRQQSDNQLYRSNSFKFERFEKYKNECSTPLHQQISLCDDYSLPVDFVNKKHLVNVAAQASSVTCTVPIHAVESTEIQLVEQYSDPKDSKNKNRKTDLSKLEDNLNKNSIYRRTYAGQEKKIASKNTKSAENNIGTIVDCVALLHLQSKELRSKSPPSNQPSPYYYGDLFKASNSHSADHRRNHLYPVSRNQLNKYCNSSNVDVPVERTRSLSTIPKRKSFIDDDDFIVPVYNLHLDSQKQKQSLDEKEFLNLADNSNEVEKKFQDEAILSKCTITEWDHTLMPPYRLLNNDLPFKVCKCLDCTENSRIRTDLPTTPTASEKCHSTKHKVQKSLPSRRLKLDVKYTLDKDDEFAFQKESDEEYKVDEEMARQRQIYETAFDCKVNRSDNSLHDLDRMTNHQLQISQMRTNSTLLSRSSSSTESSKQSQQSLQQTVHLLKDHLNTPIVFKPKNLKPNQINPQSDQIQYTCQISDNISNLSQDIESLHINSNDDKDSSSHISSRSYTPSPPSTAPLSDTCHTKYNRDQLLLNINSVSNISSQRVKTPRFKDMHLPIKPLRTKEHSSQSSQNSIIEIKSRPKSFVLESKDLILEFKGRPTKASTIQRLRPRSLVRENKILMGINVRPHETEAATTTESCKNKSDQQINFLDIKLRTSRRRPGYSSTESMTTSSSGGSMESLRSSTSEGNRSTSSSESHHSTSLSSHSSDSAGNNFYHRQHQSTLSNLVTHHATKLHILSPISDNSSQEPTSETSDNNRNNNSQKTSPEEINSLENNTNINSEVIAHNLTVSTATSVTPTDTSFKKRRTPQNKNLINLALQSSTSGDTEIQGSDSGISIESRAGIKYKKSLGFHPLQIPQQTQQQQMDYISQILDNKQEFSDLPFDMPKLRRRRLLEQQDTPTSSSATSIDLKDLPFDMPKLRRRLRGTQSIESSVSQASSSLSIRDAEAPQTLETDKARPKMSLNLDSCNELENSKTSETVPIEHTSGQFIQKKPCGLNLELPLESINFHGSLDLVDVELPLERQGWYHGSITRIEAEAILRLLQEGSYLVRNSESTKQDYSLSLKSARGFMHMRIQKNEELNAYILGQFSKPFNSIPEMVRHFSINRLPIRGAEHMCLLHPVIAQLL